MFSGGATLRTQVAMVHAIARVALPARTMAIGRFPYSNAHIARLHSRSSAGRPTVSGTINGALALGIARLGIIGREK
jgi:hypothetical protein